MASKIDHTRQMDLTASPLTIDVQKHIVSKGQIKGISKERMSELIERDFIIAQQYELIMIAKHLGLYLFQFEEKYNYQFNL